MKGKLQSERVVIRADGDEQIGLGHIMRSAALAEAFIERGVKPILVTREGVSLNDLNMPEDMTIEYMTRTFSDSEDIDRTRQALQVHEADVLITDLCHVEFQEETGRYKEYLQSVRPFCEVLVTIDDVVSGPFPSDMVVVPNYRGENRSHPNDETTYLSGIDYFICRDEFVEYRKKQEWRVKQDVEQITLTLGGGVDENGLEKVCMAIQEVNFREAVHVHVLTGNRPFDTDSILCGNKNINWTVENKTENMAKLLSRTDLAVTGGGLTKYETALLGVPSLILSQAEHQHDIMQSFRTEGTCQYLGPIRKTSAVQISDALRNLIKAPGRRDEMMRNGRNLLDENGKGRVIDAIERKFA